MKAQFNQNVKPYRWVKISVISILIWSALILASYLWNVHLIKINVRMLAIEVARTHLTKDYAFRNWAIMHKGLYATVDSLTQPNPNLKNVPERDVVTPKGQRLTLLNAAYMMRQLYEQNLMGLVKAHLTSLKPLRPENEADSWEKKALKEFENGKNEVYGFVQLNGKPYLRMMRPMYIRQSCLKCHSYQGYKVGDVRGGLSVSVPLTKYLQIEEDELQRSGYSHCAFWLFGLIFIGLAVKIKTQQQNEQIDHQRQLMESEKRFRTVADFAYDWECWFSPQGECIYISPSCKRISGYSAEEFKANPKLFVEIIYDEDKELVVQHLDDEKNKSESYEVEFRIVTKNNEIRWISHHCRPVFCECGDYLGRRSSNRDITIQKKAQQALIESEKFYKDLMELSPQITIVYDLEGKVRFCSKAVIQFLEVNSIDDLIGQSLLKYIHEDSLPLVKDRIKKLQKGEEIPEIEEKIVTASGKIKYIKVHSKKIRFKNEPSVLTTVLDITPLKKKERQLKRQLRYSQALNQVARSILSETESENLLLTIAGIAGSTIQADRSLIFKVSFEKNKAEQVALWINPKFIPTGEGPDNFSLEEFEHTLRFLTEEDQPLISHANDRHSVLERDNMARVFHEDLEVKSLLWIPFNKHQRGFNLLVFNHMNECYAWPSDDLQFVQELTALVGIALMKKRLYKNLKKMQIALQESEKRYRFLYDQSPSMYFTLNSEGRVLSVNQYGARALGYKIEELIGQNVEKVVYPPDRPKVKKDLRHALKHPNKSFNWEFRKIRKDGSVLWVSETAVANYNENNEPELLIACADISARKKAEAALQEAQQALAEKEKHYRTLFELSPYGILLEDEQGYILDVNNRFIETHGYKKEEIIGKHVSQFAHPEEKERVDENIKKILNGESLIHQVRDVSRSGQIRYVELYEKMITLPNGKRGIISLSHDITDKISAQKEKEELQRQLIHAQKMEAIGNLAGGIAHDFNNLLTVINGHAELLSLRVKNQPKIEHDVATILEAGQRAANLTRQLLTFSRKEVIKPQTLDLNQIITNLGKIVRRLISEDIHIQFKYNKKIPAITADRGQIEQILINLVINARDALSQKTDNNKIITIATSKRQIRTEESKHFLEHHPGMYVVLIVRDNGIGMSDEVRERIFEPFFTTKEAGKGTGLGLATIYGIVKQNNGFIDVKSAPGKGAEFCIYFPAEKDRKAEDSAQNEYGQGIQGNETVLLVEDDKNVRDFCTKALKNNGYKVLKAQNGNDALKLLIQNHQQVDVLVSDIIMPGMSGIDLAEEIKKHKMNCKILFTSGYTDSYDPKMLAQNGWSILCKPYSIIQLTKTIRDILDGK